MALVRDLSEAQLAFQVAGGDLDQFSVVRYRGTEGLCQLYRFEIELVSTEEQVGFDDIVGKPAVLSINADNGQRWFHGIVSRFELTGETEGQQYFRAELVPSVWFLTHRYNSRIFQGKTVPEIITDVLEKAGIPSDRFDLSGLSRTYQPRDYCVEYRETDYNFICRLMEEEGIWWYFEHTDEGHKFVAADSTSAYAPVEGEAALPYHPPAGMMVEEEHVFRFRMSQSVRPGKVVLNDFNFENPALNLQAVSDAGRDTGLEFSDYPGEYLEQSPGSDIATLRMEEFEASRFQAVGRSNSCRLAPGKTFDLTEHPTEHLNRSYLITAVTHEGRQSVTRTSSGAASQPGLLSPDVYQALLTAEQSDDRTVRNIARAVLDLAARLDPGDATAHRTLTQWLYHAGQVCRDISIAASASGANPLEALTTANLIEDRVTTDARDFDLPVYECRFEGILAETSYRPPRVTPWPVMRGTQTARVVGPSGEEIYTDEYGRVKVQFNWDREGQFDENSSCWIRVSQGSAGGQYGMMFLPRVGQEVVVDFLEGDPDKPIITGRVYNADQMPPYTLPDEKTKSVIKTHSSKGGGGTNEIRFEDLKGQEQILLYAQNNLHIRANGDRVENIGHNRHLTVKEDKFELVKKAKHTDVKLDCNEKIGGKRSLDVTGDVVEKYGANHKHEVTMTYAAKAMSIKLEASTGIELKCGGSSIVLTPAAIFIVGGPLVNINSGSGPPVGPVTATATAPGAPVDADSATAGRDVTYSGGQEPEPGEVEADIAGHPFEQREVEQEEDSWIEVELRDDQGNPVRFELCRIVTPDGRTIERSTDENGLVYVPGVKPGECEITFPNLDLEAWGR